MDCCAKLKLVLRTRNLESDIQDHQFIVRLLLSQMDTQGFTQLQRQKLQNIQKKEAKKLRNKLKFKKSKHNPENQKRELQAYKANPNFLLNQRYWNFRTELTPPMVRAIEDFKGLFRVRAQQQRYIDYNLNLLEKNSAFDQEFFGRTNRSMSGSLPEKEWKERKMLLILELL